MPRLVRKTPLTERIKAHLNVYDLLLWLSEELHESALEDALKDWTVPIGFGLNVIFIIARANSGSSKTKRRDDVFGDFDGRGGSGWFSWLASFTAHLLALLAVLNAIYTFTRRRHYRLFESSIDEAPSTPSARRVRVDSSPASSSPLRVISSLMASTSAASRAHPDEHRDVWEVRVWDPKELNLDLFTFFSPGHIVIYWLSLPTTALDPRPSVTVVTAILIAALFTLQLVLLRKFFTQQAKDSRLINKEVMNEYDTKFVHPTLNRPVRDVAVQTRQTATSPRVKTREVDVYTPTTVINRGFKINPNPNYASHLGTDVDSSQFLSPTRRLPRSSTTSALKTPLGGERSSFASFGTQADRPAEYSASPLRMQHQRERSPIKGDGGSLGIYSHAASPLKKASSSNHLRLGGEGDRLLGRDRSGSPLKRTSTPGNGSAGGLEQRFNGLCDGRRDTGRL